MGYAVASMTIEDYEEAVALWQSTEGIGLSGADTREAIAAYLARNPGMSFVARGQQGELVGAVLCGHDGRRGYLHHAAVRADCRGQGVGSALVNRCMEALQAVGIDKCHIFVYKDNRTGREFWEKTGWVERVTLVIMSKDIG